VPLLDVTSTPVNVVDRGHGDAVVFLHAFPLQAAMWDYQVEALESTHRCVAIDMPGFGPSPEPEDPDTVTMQRWAGVVVEVLDALGIDKATFVGSSLGGYLIMALLRHHPERVGQIVLMGTRATSDDAAAGVRRTEHQEQLRNGAEVSTLAKGVVESLLSSGSLSRDDLVEYVHALADGAAPSGWIAALQAMKTRADSMFVLRQAGRAGLRSLILVGELDRVTPLAEAMSLRSLLKGELVVVPNVGHLPNLEDPLAVDEALAAFLAPSASPRTSAPTSASPDAEPSTSPDAEPSTSPSASPDGGPSASPSA
jgi:pimeloyl-ACP methyl ester carboxylesterase